MTTTRPMDAWRAKVEADLAGAPFDKALVTPLREGLALQPVYAGPTPEAGWPGVFPFVRGGRAADGRWARTQLYRPEEARDIAADLAGGTDGVWLEGEHDLATSLAGVDPARTLIATEQQGAQLLDHLQGRTARSLVLGGPIAEAPQRIESATRAGHVDARAVLITAARDAHDQGAHAVQEIALALRDALQSLRALDAAGLAPDRVAPHFAFAFSTGRDVLLEIAKLRAARLCWAKVLRACDVGTFAPMWIHAETSRRMLSTRDPWVNMLRVTTATFAAAVGGADSIASLPYDDALETATTHDPLARRVARNTSIVLAEESHLGEVVDPAGGSHAIEALTQQLARAAWAELQALEAGADPTPRVEAAWKTLRADVAKRKHALTGVSEFPDATEAKPTRSPRAPRPDQRREAEVFEALRAQIDAHATRPKVFLATLGTLAEHGAREAFARGYFGVAGLEIAADPGTQGGPSDVATLAAHFSASGARVACICGTDAAYEAHAVDLTRALHAARSGARIYLAGRPGAREAELRAAGVHDFVFLGSDVEATLARLVQELSS